jgi:hypothetical protein
VVGGDAAWVAPALRPLVGLEGAADGISARRDESFAAWRRFFERLAERHPLVLVFEDLHRADDALLDFIEHLVEWAGDVPILAASGRMAEADAQLQRGLGFFRSVRAGRFIARAEALLAAIA